MIERIALYPVEFGGKGLSLVYRSTAIMVCRGRINLKGLVPITIVGLVLYFAWANGLLNKFSRLSASHGDIIIYVSNRCGPPCDRLTDTVREENVLFQVLNVDEDQEYAKELRTKLDSIGFRQTIYHLPVIDIYGEILSAPSIKDVQNRLSK